MPQIAITFPSFFYLPDYFLFLLPFDEGLALSVIFHVIIAGSGTYLLTNAHGFSKAQALVSSFIFSLSGYMFCLSSNHSLIAGLSWIPISLWSLKRLEKNHSTNNAFWRMLQCAVSLLMFLLSGRPEIIAPGLITLIIYVIVMALHRRAEDGNFFDSTLLWQIRSMGLALAFSMPSLLPVAEWLSRSKRATGLQSEEVFLYSAHWYDILSMFTGPSLGDLRLHSAPFRKLLSPANLPPYVSCSYVGPIAATMCTWGIFDSAWRGRWPVLVLLTAVICASLGSSTAVAPFFVHLVPALGFVRFPIKLLGFATFLVGLTAAQGLKCLTSKKINFKSTFSAWTAFLVFGEILLLASASGGLCLDFHNPSQTLFTALAAQSCIGESILLCSVCGLGLTLLAYLAQSKNVPTNITSTGLVCMLVASLLVHAYTFERKGAPAAYWAMPSFTADKVKSFEKQLHVNSTARILNLCFERLSVPPPDQKHGEEAETIWDYQYDRQILKQNCNMNFGLPESFGFEGSARGDYSYLILHAYLESSQSIHPEVSPATDAPLARVCAITSTRFVITQNYRIAHKVIPVAILNDHFFRLLLDDPKMNTRIYEVRNCLPHYYFTHNWTWSNSHNKILTNLVGNNLSNIDPFSETVLENLSKSYAACKPLTPIFDSADNVFPINDEQLSFLSETKASGFLILSDQFYPGWHAYVDGKISPIYQANGFTRAVFVKSGKHTIEFRYEPESLYLGIILAVLGVVLTFYLYFAERLRI